MATSNLSLNYRPIRIGFLVKEGSLDDLVLAAKINTLLWGGIYNPIIPVGGGTNLPEQLIELYAVDVLHRVSQTDEINVIYDKYNYLRTPYYYEDVIYKKEEGGKEEIRFFDILHIIKYYWEKEFKFAREPESNCMFIKWENGNPFDTLFTIIFGKYPESFNRFENAFLKGLKAKEVFIGKEDNIDTSLIQTITPLLLTQERIFPYGISHSDKGLYVGDENNFDDLVTFWNLRAADYSIVFYPIENHSLWRDFTKSYINKIDEVPDRYQKAPDRILFYFLNRSDINKIREIADTFETKKEKGFCACSGRWNGLNIIPHSIRSESKSVLADVDHKYNRYTITFQLPEMSIIDNERKDDRRQLLVVSISPISEFEYPEHTLKIPYIRKLNKYFSREISIDPLNLRVEKAGIAKITQPFRDSITLFPISHQNIINKLFDFVGITTKISQAGLLAQKIIENFEGLNSMYAFKIRGVRELIDSMKTSDSTTRGNATKMIYKNGMFNKFEKMYLENSNKKKNSSNDVFDYLLKKDIFRAGLELKCSNCRLISWLSLKAIDAFWNCDYCGYKNITSIHLRDRGDWKFRRSGLFFKDNNQEGAIPVLLTLLLLSNIFRRGFHELMYSYSLELSFDSESIEIDFAVVNRDTYGMESPIEIAVGECKNEGGEITQEDIDNLKKVRTKFNTNNLKCFLIFSKTADSFTDNEINLFKELGKENIPIILFTNKELESLHDVYEDYKGKKLPRDYPDSLSDMAWNSKGIYLG